MFLKMNPTRTIIIFLALLFGIALSRLTLSQDTPPANLASILKANPSIRAEEALK